MVGSTREEENRLRINDAIVRLRDEMKPLVVEVIGEAIRRKRWSLDRNARHLEEEHPIT